MKNVLLLVSFLAACPVAIAAPSDYFKIKVVDDQTGRGVPLVELRTVHNLLYYTDSNGIVAFHEPGLMDRKVFFFVQSHGYEFPKDGFGYAGVALEAKPGGSAEIKIKRRNLAERLYRLTGAGIYADSVLVGEPVPLEKPLLNGEVLGQDTVMALPWNDRIYWFWGDTNRLRYALGQFHTSGATSLPPGRGGLGPAKGVDLDYFVGPDGFSRPMCPREGAGPVWIEGVFSATDENGKPRMVARWTDMKSLGEMRAHGLAVFDDDAQVFRITKEFDLKDQWRCPRGRPFTWNDAGTEYVLFPTPYATVRVKPDLKSVSNPEAYEAFTCLQAGTRYDKNEAKLDRGPQGELVWNWKPRTEPITVSQERELIAAGKMKPDEARFQPKDIESGKPILLHAGTLHWNAFRKAWILVAVEQFGSSMLGEVWFLESPSPLGPWRYGRKIVTHDKYTFYNPAHHPFFDEQGGRIIYFQGTYANTFSGNPVQTPRYDYNQIMYRLDLANPSLSQPLAPAKSKSAETR